MPPLLLRFSLSQWRCLFLLIVFLMGGVARAKTIHVFLIGGQSNGDGRATTTGLPPALANPQADVPYYYAKDTAVKPGVPTNQGTLTTLRPNTTRIANTFGPELTFGRSMADFYAAKGESIALIKFAAGGTDLYSQWGAGGTSGTSGDGSVYTNFQNIVTSGLAALRAAHPTDTLSINGMIWMQGESDAVADHSADYQTNLENFITDIRLTYGANLPFIIGELSSAQTGTGAAVDRNNVRTAQLNVANADPLTGLVNTDNFTLNADNLHFDNAGQQALGNAFATSMQSFVAVPEPTTVGLLGAAFGLAAITRRFRLRRQG